MKANIIIATLALCLVATPAVEAATMAVEGVNETLLPAKKTTKKKTTSKKSTKKTTTKKSSSTKKSTASASTKDTETPAVAQPVAATEEKAQEKETTTSSAGSSILGGILSSVIGGATGSSSENGAGDILSGLTSIFNSSKVAKKDQIVGTWTYTEPAVVLSSSNVLKNIGGKVASETIEKQLQNQFEKYGIKKGAMTMTFDKDGNFTQTVGSKSMSGTYSISGKNVTLKYAGGVQQFVGTTQLDGNDLLIVMDASKLLKYAKTIGSLTGNSLLSGAGSLLSSMDGMEIGLKLNK